MDREEDAPLCQSYRYESDEAHSEDSDFELEELRGDSAAAPLTGVKPSARAEVQPDSDDADSPWAVPWWQTRRTVMATILIFVILVILTGFGWHKYKEEPVDGLSPAWYPTPLGGTSKNWEESYKKAAMMVSNMTLAEKVNITTGTGWRMGLAVGNTGPATIVGFPSLALQDGPLGLRFADNATAFPAGLTVGATWNKDLMYERGSAHGKEARGKGINILLGPSVGPLGRAPAGGRNWEGFGADPYLQGIAAAQTIKGIQDQHVMATIKHYIANEQEHFRQAWAWGLPHAISSNIDDRTLHELYAWPFMDAIKAGVASVMCSYNMVNNSYACGNSKLMNGILKDEMGFQGFVMSDWLAQRSGVASALAGLDMSMPGDGLGWEDGDSLWGPHLSRAVLNGSLPLSRLNDMTVRIVASWYQVGQDDEAIFDRKGPNFSSWTFDALGSISPGSPSDQSQLTVNHFVDVQSNHSILARDIAIEGTVLVKNDGLLPLTRKGRSLFGQDRPLSPSKTRIGIFGEDAGPGKGPNHCEDRGCNQGTLGSGWGSGAVNFPYLIPPVKGITDAINAKHVEVKTFLTNQQPKDRSTLADLDICLVFANSDGGEGFLTWNSVAGDRNDLDLQLSGDELIQSVAESCGNGRGKTVVVIHSVGPVIVEKWIDMPSVSAVIFANLPGQESGNAIASIIFGDVNPSGKLPYTVGKSLADYGNGGQVMYKPNRVVPQQDFDEGLYIDYRHFDKLKIEPRFEFGFGLSYTTFELTNLRVTEVRPKSAHPAQRPANAIKAPTFDDRLPDISEALFPKSIRKLKKYIYPYIESASEIQHGSYPYPAGYRTEQPASQAGGEEGGNPALWETHVTVTVDAINTGRMSGKAVVQLYVSFPETPNIDFPIRALRGFDKVHLAQGDTATLTFHLTRRDLSYWSTIQQNWVMPTGTFTITVGQSSRDLQLSATW